MDERLLLSALAAPRFAATAISATQIRLSWNRVAGAVTYGIREKINGVWRQICTLGKSTTSCVVGNLSPGTIYGFEVGASSRGRTTWARAQSVRTLVAPPTAPSFAAIAISPSQIYLAWNAVGGATGYAIAEWINGSWTVMGRTGSTAFTIGGLSPGCRYYFDVVASNSWGSTWGTSQYATTFPPGGIDHPAAQQAYSPTSGSLFGYYGPLFVDVRQGALGDCWLLASLAEVAARKPADIQGMFVYEGLGSENGSIVGLYQVRLYDDSGNPHYFTVDTELPAGGNYYDHPYNNILWAALAEKAFVQANGQGLVHTQYAGWDSYAALQGGLAAWAFRAITGNSSGTWALDPDDVGAAWNLGYLVVIGTKSQPSDPCILGGHAYAVVGYNPSSSYPFEIYNPWGTGSDGWVPGQPYYGCFWANDECLIDNYVQENFGIGAGNRPVRNAGGTFEGKPNTNLISSERLGTMAAATVVAIPRRAAGGSVMSSSKSESTLRTLPAAGSEYRHHLRNSIVAGLSHRLPGQLEAEPTSSPNQLTVEYDPTPEPGWI